MIHHILLATNGSAASQRAADYAIYLAGISDAALSVLFVADNRLCHYGEVDQLVTETTKAQFIAYVSQGNDAECRRALEQLSEKACASGVAYTSRTRSGKPETEIVAEAVEINADLVILGGKRPSGRKFMPSSSISGKVLKRCPCPVFIAS